MAYVRKTFNCERCGIRKPNNEVVMVGDQKHCFECVVSLGNDVTSCDICGRLEYCTDLDVDTDDRRVCVKCYEAGLIICHLCDTHLDTDYINQPTASCIRNSQHGFKTEWMVDGLHYCESCYNSSFLTCSECGEVIVRGQESSDLDGNDVCPDCYDELYICCGTCGRTVPIEDAVDGYHCSNCRAPTRNNRYWNPQRFRPDSNSYRRIGSRRRFGIELEYNSVTGGNNSVESLRYFGRKGEHCGVEFYSSILQGDRGLDAVENLGSYAVENNWQISNSCGYHLHLDMRDETTAKMHVLAYAYRKTYHVWSCFVDRWRRNHCDFCHPMEETASYIRQMTLHQFATWMYESARYNFVNWNAHGDHGTVEIRLHYATCEPVEIVNWVKVHSRFVDWGLQQTMDSVDSTFNGELAHDFDALANIWESPTLRSYYRSRAADCEARIPRLRRPPTPPALASVAPITA